MAALKFSIIPVLGVKKMRSRLFLTMASECLKAFFLKEAFQSKRILSRGKLLCWICFFCICCWRRFSWRKYITCFEKLYRGGRQAVSYLVLTRTFALKRTKSLWSQSRNFCLGLLSASLCFGASAATTAW